MKIKSSFLLLLSIFFLTFNKPYSYAQNTTLVALVENKELGFHYIDNNGNVLIGKSKGNQHDFSDGLLRKEARGYGFVDVKDNWVIKPTYIDAGNFSEGFAAVEKNFVGWGFINKKGELAIDYLFGAVHYFSEGRAPVRKGGFWGFIDTTGRLVIESKYSDFTHFKNGYARVKLFKGAWNIIDRNGKTVTTINSTIEEVGNLANGRILIKQNSPTGISYYGYLDSLGSQLITSKYLAAKDFSEGLAPVKEKNLWGYIDPSGQYVVEPQYSSAEDFVNGVARVKLKGKWGAIDKKGNVVIETKYEGLRDFVEGLAAAKEKSTWGYINLKGEWVIKPTYQTAKDFSAVK